MHRSRRVQRRRLWGATARDRVPAVPAKVARREEARAAGRAVRANYRYAGATDLYAKTGDRSLLVPLLAVWEDLVSTKLYVTGG